MLFPLLLFPNSEEFRCLDANSGLTFGLFLPPVGSEAAVAAAADVDELVGAGVVVVGVLTEALLALDLPPITVAGVTSFLSFISSSMVDDDSKPVEISSLFGSSDVRLSAETVLGLSSAEDLDVVVVDDVDDEDVDDDIDDVTDVDGEEDCGPLMAGAALFTSLKLTLSREPVAISDPPGLLACGFMKGNLGRVVEARCEPNKLGFWLVAPPDDLFRSVGGWVAEFGGVVVDRVRAVKLFPNLVRPTGDGEDELDDDEEEEEEPAASAA